MKRIRLIAIATVFAAVGSAEAHPPYEGAPKVLRTPAGNVEVVKSYVDGIFATDPAKVIVRSQGQVHAETDFYRDASVACFSGRCLIAATDSFLPILPERVWLVKGASVTSLNSTRSTILGVLVHLWDHFIGYAIALALLLPLLTAVRGGVKDRQAGSAGGCAAALAALGAVGVLVIWLYAVVILSELSLFWVLVLAMTFVAMRRAVRRRRANEALQLTKPAQAMELRS